MDLNSLVIWPFSMVEMLMKKIKVNVNVMTSPCFYAVNIFSEI